MTKQDLVANIRRKRTFLCVGLDPDLKKLPAHLLQEADPIFAFNKAVIDATAPYCVAYKPNLAFYECFGLAGWQAYERTVAYLREKHPDQFIIADAKRGDIVLLALTSNKGSHDFQLTADERGERLFERVLRTSQSWGSDEQMMYVVGATQGSLFADIRRIAPRHFLLVPGVGAQGGSLEEVCRYGMTDECGLLVNSSRGIIYADATERFAQVAGEKARELQQEMDALLVRRDL